MNNSILKAAAISGAVAVVIGAYGAHGLKPHLTDYQSAIFEKGVQYQFFHTLAMLFCGLFFGLGNGRNQFFRKAGWLFLAGIVCFSGSLFLLACRDLIAVPVGFVGPITPLGGLLFIAGWCYLLVGFMKNG